MAEFCRECFIKAWHPSQDEIDHIVMSDDNDFCEGCMNCGPYVLYIGDPKDKEEYVNFNYDGVFLNNDGNDQLYI